MANDAVYSWRPTGSQQPSYFGALRGPSYGNNLNQAVANNNGFPSPVAQPAAQAPAGFNVPGGSSAGFNSPAFSGASGPAPKADDGATPSFANSLRQNPFATQFPTSPTEAASQAALRSAVGNLQPSQTPTMSSMFSLNEYNKGEAEALRQAKEADALNGRAMTGQIGGDVADYVTQKLIPQRQEFLGQLQGQEEQQQIARQQNAQQNIATLAGQANQSQQAAAALASQEKIASGQQATAVNVANIGAQAATQNAQLSAATQKYIADNNLNLNYAQLNAQISQFASNQDFQKWATQAGIDANAAHDMWQANQNDIQRKWETGQQLTANEQQVRMESLQEAHDTAMANLNHTLNLDTLDKQTQQQVLLKTMDQNFQSLMTDKNFSNEEALDATKQQYAEELAKMGYDHDTAMQASQQWFDAQQQQKQLDQAKTLAEAQMAQQYDFFNQDLQQKYNFKAEDVQMAKDQLAQQASQFAQSLGLDQQKFDLLKSTTDFQNLSDTTSTLMAMSGDNKDMLQFAAENFYKSLGNMKDANGQPIMSPDQVNQGILNIKAASFSDPSSFSSWAAGQKNADGSPAYTSDQIKTAQANSTNSAGTAKAGLDNFNSILSSSGAFTSPDAQQKLTDNILSYTNTAATLPTSGMAHWSNGDGGIFDTAAARLRTKGTPEPKIQANMQQLSTGTFSTHNEYNASQQGADYAAYANLIANGMKEADAQRALTALVGDSRAKAALALEGK